LTGAERHNFCGNDLNHFKIWDYGSCENLYDAECKQLANINQRLYKLWQDNKADNARLETDLAQLKQNLEKTQKRLISYNQKAVLTSVEYEDYIRNEAEIKQKVGKLEKDLKMRTMSEQLTDKTLSHLRCDNSRLRKENAGLVSVVSHMVR